MYRETYINSFQTELVQIVANHLTPSALRYGYSEVPLETNIKWRSQILIIGNYSSGKSTLINELIGTKIQATGQAPTDDSFTIITYNDAEDDGNAEAGSAKKIRVTEERDGKVLLNDPEYPFESLRKHGERFASHFRLKKVSSDFLKNLAIIDTPGMLDSFSEKDRGYNYQEVIGSLAEIADLVIVLFDPHKAGTVREAHTSLRDILPARTFEDRILFVLNRVDECSSLTDLLRVYGTLCWNLSQITGRKDIPMIHLTYSPNATGDTLDNLQKDKLYLRYLENQRDELKKAILHTPYRRLDHLAAFIETHSERLSHLLEALISYRKRRFSFRVRNTVAGFFVSLLCGAGSMTAMLMNNTFAYMDRQMIFATGGGIAAAVLLLWLTLIQKLMTAPFHRKILDDLDSLTPLDTQKRKDVWNAVRETAYTFLRKSGGNYPSGQVKYEYENLCKIRDQGSQIIREALNELSTAKNNDEEFDASIFGREPFRTKETGIL